MSVSELTRQAIFEFFNPTGQPLTAFDQFKADYAWCFDVDIENSPQLPFIQAWCNSDLERVTAANFFHQPPAVKDLPCFATKDKTLTLLSTRSVWGPMVSRAESVPSFLPVPPPAQLNLAYHEQLLGYVVHLPMRLSSHQQGWLSLVNPPMLLEQGKPYFLFTANEYEFLKRMRILTSAHACLPISMFALSGSYLAGQLNKYLPTPSRNQYAGNPELLAIAQAIYLHTFSAQSPINVNDEQGTHGIQHLASYQTLLNFYRHLANREERLHQLMALTYGLIATKPSKYNNQPNLISPEWFTFNVLANADKEQARRERKAHNGLGYYLVSRSNKGLAINLAALAVCGIITDEEKITAKDDEATSPVKSRSKAKKSTKPVENNGLELLFDAIENAFVVEADNELSEIKDILLEPENYLALKPQLMRHSTLMLSILEACMFSEQSDDSSPQQKQEQEPQQQQEQEKPQVQDTGDHSQSKAIEDKKVHQEG